MFFSCRSMPLICFWIHFESCYMRFQHFSIYMHLNMSIWSFSNAFKLIVYTIWWFLKCLDLPGTCQLRPEKLQHLCTVLSHQWHPVYKTTPEVKSQPSDEVIWYTTKSFIIKVFFVCKSWAFNSLGCSPVHVSIKWVDCQILKYRKPNSSLQGLLWVRYSGYFRCNLQGIHSPVSAP